MHLVSMHLVSGRIISHCWQVLWTTNATVPIMDGTFLHGAAMAYLVLHGQDLTLLNSTSYARRRRSREPDFTACLIECFSCQFWLYTLQEPHSIL